MMRIKDGKQMTSNVGYREKTERLNTGSWRCQKRNLIVRGQRRFNNGRK